jgi:ADP-heptose:LPS heptosyltransferase
MPKALVIRPGHAIGDAVFVTPIPRLLSEKGYEVHVACMAHNNEVFANNPYVTKTIPLPSAAEFGKWVEEFRDERAQYSEVFRCSGHVEVGLLYRTDSRWGAIPSAPERRHRAKNVVYQDRILEALGFEERGLLPEFYFTKEENDAMERMYEDKTKKKEQLVLWQWDGSSGSKTLTFAPVYLRDILKKKQHVRHYVFTPNPNLQGLIPESPKVHNAWGKSGIRNSIQLAAMADLVVGPESFMVNAAAGFQTPKVIFFSHSAPDNLAKYYENCFAAVPIESVDCHPCYLIHVDFRNVFHPEKRALARLYEKHCQTYDPKFPYRVTGYKCCFYMPHNNIMNTISQALKIKVKRTWRTVKNGNIDMAAA